MLNQLLRYEPLSRLVNEAGPGPVLEVGSGPRGLAAYLPGREITGVDPSFPPDAVQLNNFLPVKGSVLSLPFPDASFPVVLSSDMLEHLPEKDRPAAIAELLRVTSHTLILSFPALESHARWEGRLKRAYGLFRLPPPDWLLEHEGYGLPSAADVAGQLRAAGADFRELPNENNLVHFAVMLAEMTPLCGFLNFVSDVLAPNEWDGAGRSWKARAARLLLSPFRGLPSRLSFGSTVRTIFVARAPGRTG